MFGFSFGELVVLVIVAIVVIGPKDLPKVLRKLGQMSGKLRRMASDLRAQSGIDDVLRNEGLSEDIAEIRKLARGELDNVVRSARVDLSAASGASAAAASSAANSSAAHRDPYGHDEPIPIDREREYPRDGADSYRALPDTAIVYAETLPVSPHAEDALYMLGDANGVLAVLARGAAPRAPDANGSTSGPDADPHAPTTVATAPAPEAAPPQTSSTDPGHA